MIWTTVSSWSCFCWLYRASPPLAEKNIINLILALTIWWCPCVECSLVLLEKGVCYDLCVLLQNSVNLCSASFCTPKPNFPVTPVISWLPTFVFQSPVIKRTSFFSVLILEGLVGLHRPLNFSFFSIIEELRARIVPRQFKFGIHIFCSYANLFYIHEQRNLFW